MSGKQKQSSKAKPAREKGGLLEMAHLSIEPPFNLLQNFFFLDFVTREKRKCLKKKKHGIHHTDRKLM